MSDIHRETAAALFGVPVEEVTPEMRARARTVNAATLHGSGPNLQNIPIRRETPQRTLSGRLSDVPYAAVEQRLLSTEEAQQMRERFRAAYPDVERIP